MYQVEMTVLEGGERMPVLYRTNPYQPLVVPLLYVTLRRRYLKSRTLLRDLHVLGALYQWCESVREAPFDLDACLARGELLSTTDIEAFLRWLRSGRTQTGSSKPRGAHTSGALKPISLNNYAAALRSFLLWAAERYRPERDRDARILAYRAHASLIENAFCALRMRGRTSGEEKGLERDQLQKLFEIVHHQHPKNPFRPRLRARNALIVELLYHSGIRRGELLKLKVEDLLQDEESRCFLRIRRRADDPTDTRAVEPGQKTDDRVLAIHESLYHALIRYVRQERRPVRHGRAMKLPHAFLFVSERGAALAESEVNYILTRLAMRCFGTRVNVHPHVLRHSFCNDFMDYCTEVERLDEEGAKDRLRALCGWNAASSMPERYTRKRIQREANTFNLRRQTQARALLVNERTAAADIRAALR